MFSKALGAVSITTIILSSTSVNAESWKLLQTKYEKGERRVILMTSLLLSLVLQNILFRPLPIHVSPSGIPDYIALDYFNRLQFSVPFYSTSRYPPTVAKHVITL